MIEKLPFEITQGEYEGKKFDIKSHTSPFDMQVKINEIVDLLNAIVVDVDGTKCVDGSKSPAENVQPDAESHPENVQDKFAEQRKWIGKICKFWDIDNDNLYYGPLTKIHDTSPYYYECNHKVCYANCEPVSEDLIYKGGDNE